MNTLRALCSSCLFLMLLVSCTGPETTTVKEHAYKTIGSLEAHAASFHRLVPKTAELEIIAEGFDWIEGPVWVADGGHLLFSDIPRNSIYKWKEGEGCTLFMKPSGYTGAGDRDGEPGSNGLALDPQGRLVLCEHGDHRISRLQSLSTPNGPKETLVSSYEGKRLNSPNDLVFHSDGSIYFTDPPYGLEKNVNDPAKELPFQGVYRMSPDGDLTLLTKELTRPNGLAFSPDETKLYIANSDPRNPVWYQFDVLEDGSIANRRIFYDTSSWGKGRRGLPDGMTIDCDGTLFATGPGGICVLSPEGALLGIIQTGQATSNCTWGGKERSTLYITADSYLLRIKTNTKGPMLP